MDNYSTLATKYRPSTFQSVAQKHVTRVLKAQIKTDTVPAAQLFSGQPGTGKTTLARVMAMALECEDDLSPNIAHQDKNGDMTATRHSAEPCGVCRSCKAIRNGSYRDLIEVNCADNNGVDNVRDLIATQIRVQPTGKFRTFLLDEAHMLTTQAQNALLKILEEPPPYVKFFLCTTDPLKVIPAIRSRSQHHQLSPVSNVDCIAILKDVVKQEKLMAEDAALQLIAAQAGGSARTALVILEHVSKIGVTEENVREVLRRAPRELVVGLLTAIAEADRNEAFRLLDAAQAEGRDLSALMEECARVVMTLVRYRVNRLKTPEDAALTGLFAAFHGVPIVDIATNLLDIITKIRQNVPADLICQVGIFKIIDRFAKLKENAKS